jgi:hypothetical protein
MATCMRSVCLASKVYGISENLEDMGLSIVYSSHR